MGIHSLKVKDLFTGRRVYVAEPGHDVREAVVYESPRNIQFPIWMYSISKEPVPKYLQPKENLESLKSHGPIDHIIETKQWIFRKTFSLIIDRALYKLDDCNIGEDSATRIFRKLKHAKRYSELPKLDNVDSIFGDEEDSAPRTVAGQWRVDGEPDPFDTRYTGDRSKITLGHEPDLKITIIVMSLWGTLCSAGYLTAAKERIRWLSRRIFLSDDLDWIGDLEVARAKLPMGELTDDEMANAVFMNGDSKNKIEAHQYLVAARDRIKWLHDELGKKGLNVSQD